MRRFSDRKGAVRMLDGTIRKRIDPHLQQAGEWLAVRRIGADLMTLVACGLGLLSAAFIALGHSWIALPFLLASRLGDGLDGAIARATGKTDFGGFLDIVLDFVFYGAVPLAFVIADPGRNGIAGAVLLFAFYVNGSSFLAFAVMAEKRRLTTDARGEKSFYFTTGLAEATETIAVFAVACVFAAWFWWLAYLFAALTLYTAAARILFARSVMREEQPGRD
jgi:phosphatidylglycerophosphate synthase